MMKTMKISMFLAALIAGFLFQDAAAQTTERTKLTAEERAQKLTEWMKKELTLTAAQEPTVHAINLKYADQMDDIKASEGDRRSKFKDAKATGKAKDDELKAVLTPEQFTIYSQKKEEMKQKMRENRKRG
jgi:phage portal protein BeeE